MPHLITLIHGTFAKKAPWTLDGSEFCDNLKLHLGNDIVIKEFHWSCKNSHKARVSASLDLAEKLKQQMTSHPNERKIILAHSHGGNIAMYALRELNLAGDHKEFELVTMATPFLNPKKGRLIDNLEPYVKLIALNALVIFALLATIVLVVLVIAFYKEHPIYSIGFMGISTIFGNYVFVPYIEKHLRRKFALLPKIIDQLVYRLSFDQLKNGLTILVVIDRWDEIKLFFSGLSRIWGAIFNLYLLLVLFARRSAKLIALSFVLVFIFSIMSYNYPISWLLIFCAMTLLFWFLFPSISLAFSFILYFFRSNILALGWESIYEQMFILIKTSITPFESKKLSFIEYKLKRKSRFSLKHSIYNHEKVIKDICAWIKRDPKIR
ncbi:hypothetical protein [Pedobacter nutrimenti]|uniref:hypothetical protein n=1 Tax=Pedobacter nutrimenti TaxID=1241337 RepID=UPI00292F3451|nr:hypothetical protein [Pedobacter nutrimenti]